MASHFVLETVCGSAADPRVEHTEAWDMQVDWVLYLEVHGGISGPEGAKASTYKLLENINTSSSKPHTFALQPENYLSAFLFTEN
jgi:hypothetical protein